MVSMHCQNERVFVGHQLAVAREPFQRFLFEVRRVAVDVVEDLRLQHEEGAVDPAFLRLRLFRELGDPVAVEFEMTEARRRANCGQRRQLSVRTVERQQLVQVDVGHAVAPGEHERPVAQAAVRDA